MVPDTEYWHVPQEKESNAAKFYRGLDEKDRALLHDMYVNGRVQIGNDADTLHEFVSQLGAEGRAEIEALAADEFGPPDQASKGEMFKRDSGRGKMKMKEKRIGKGKYEIKM